MDKVVQCFQKAWDDLAREYKQWKYWNERDVVVALVGFINKHLLEGGLNALEVHTNVSLSPNTWLKCKLLEKYETKLKRESGHFPIIDIVILNVTGTEDDAEPFKLAAEVKFSGFVKNGGKRITAEWEKFQKDIERLGKLVSLGICESAFFCYLDEYHKDESIEEIRERIKAMREKYGKSMYYCYHPFKLNQKNNKVYC